MTLAPPLLHILIALAGIVQAIRTRPRAGPRLLPIYLAFIVFAALTGAAVLQLLPAGYRSAFWVLEMAHNLILCALALEIVAEMLPRRFAVPWALFFFTVLLVSVARQWPSISTPVLLNVSVSALCTAGLLLAGLVFVEIEWPPAYGWAAAGVALVIAGNLLPSLAWLQGRISPFALQCGDLPGLFALALRVESRATISS